MKRFVFLVLCSLVAALSFGKVIKVACVGNSITYGTGIQNRAKDSYPAQLQQMLGSAFRVENFGKPGATLLKRGHRPYTMQEEFHKALAFKADIVVIHLGINDTDPRDWPNYRDDFIKDYRSLIDSFRVVNPNCLVLIARLTPITVYHPRFISGTRDWEDDIQKAVEKVAAYTDRVQLIDFHTPLYSHPDWIPDAVHPNEKGATLLARTVYESITGDFGGLQLSPLYTDKMVLQHGIPLKINGIANVGESVTVSINKEKKSVTTGQDGKWQVTLPALKAGGPYTLTVATKKKKLVFHDVLAGEVWYCSGQSNMEFRLNQCSTGKLDIPHSSNSSIRLFDMKGRWETYDVAWPVEVLDSVNNLNYFHKAVWTDCNPTTAARFSAIAYYFGKELQDSLKVPVGLICNAVGGSPLEAWIDRSTLEHRLPAILINWKSNDFIMDWVRGRAVKNISLRNDKFQRHPYEPCYLYEAGMLPLDAFPVKGMLWYQGESNAHNIEAHEQLFKLAVNSWRTYWKNPQMPVYFVQLSGLNRPSWPWFRDSQRRLMEEIPNTGMVVSMDKGDSLDVHYPQKKEIGRRLAFQALNHSYGFTKVLPSGPLFRSAVFEAGKAIIDFDYAKGLTTGDGKPVSTFELAGEDGLFYPAEAEISGDKVIVHSKEVTHPVSVRYAWQPFTRANLVNEAGLPASTFRFNKQ